MQQKLSRRSFIVSTASVAASLLAACSGPEELRTLGDKEAVEASDRSASTATPRQRETRTATSSPATPAPESPTSSVTGTGAPGGLSTPTPSPTATRPRQLTVAIDPAVARSLAPRAVMIRDELAASLGGKVVDDDADYVIGVAEVTPSSSAAPILPVDYVAVVSRRLLVRDIEFSQLGELWNGSIADWSDVGSPVPHGVVRILLQGSSGPLDSERADRDVASMDELIAMLDAERGGLAIIPRENIDFRLRTLSIDGISPIRPEDNRNPLRVDFEVRARDGVDTTAMRSMITSFAGPRGPEPVSMTWAGDIIFGRLVHVKMVSYGDWAAPFRSIHPELTWADVTISNLECAISDSYETPTDPTTFDFKTDPPAVEGLQLAQIDILSRANNHSYNFGAIGMRDTTAILEQAGILHFGMGESIHESRQATVIERGGSTYAFLGYNGISDAWDGADQSSPGTNPMLDWLVVEDVKREVERGHVVIPFFHWGTEYVYDPTEQQRYFAHIAIQAGAAMVMGSHPHWVQAVETYMGKSIVYSLGNFVFDQEWSLETKQGMIAHTWMQGDKLLSIDLVPILIEDYHKPRRMANWEAWPVLEEVWAASDRIY